MQNNLSNLPDFVAAAWKGHSTLSWTHLTANQLSLLAMDLTTQTNVKGTFQTENVELFEIGGVEFIAR